MKSKYRQIRYKGRWQEKIETSEPAWKYFDNTKELLVYVVAEYGQDALFGGRYFADHTSPFMSLLQKNLLKHLFDCGAARILQVSVGTTQQHKEVAIKQAVGKLINTYATAEEHAERIVLELANAIGWRIDKHIQDPKCGVIPLASAPNVRGENRHVKGSSWKNREKVQALSLMQDPRRHRDLQPLSMLPPPECVPVPDVSGNKLYKITVDREHPLSVSLAPPECVSVPDVSGNKPNDLHSIALRRNYL